MLQHLSDQNEEYIGALLLFGPPDHLLLYKDPHVNALLSYYYSKPGLLRLAEYGLVLRWHESVGYEP